MCYNIGSSQLAQQTNMAQHHMYKNPERNIAHATSYRTIHMRVQEGRAKEGQKGTEHKQATTNSCFFHRNQTEA